MPPWQSRPAPPLRAAIVGVRVAIPRSPHPHLLESGLDRSPSLPISPCVNASVLPSVDTGLDYPIRSSVGLLFPDDSALIFGDEKVWVSRMASSSRDTTVYHYIDDLVPIVPIGRYRRVPYAARFLFTELEQGLVNQATQILDTLLLNEQGLKLPTWMRWFPNDRLLVKNLISAGGDAGALCSLLLGMLSNGRLTLLGRIV